MWRWAAVLVLLASVSAGLVAIAESRPLPSAKRCRIFPKDSHWNRRVDNLPVAGNSDAIVRRIGADDNVHADFGSGTWEGGPIGIPYKTVSKKQKRVPVSFEYEDESDRGRYPIPANAPIEGGPD